MSDYFHSICLGNYLVELPKSTLPASHAEKNGAFTFYCSSSIPKHSPTWIYDKPAILMGTGGVASVHLGKERYAYSTDTWAFRIINDELNIDYVYRLIQLYLDKIDYSGFEGSGLRHLRKDFIKKLVFDVPNTEYQQKIAAILTSIDTAIEKTEALIVKYRHIKAGLMHDLFTRGVTSDGKLRPPHELAPELYQQTPIGWIPKEWVLKTLEEVVSFQRGYDIVESDFVDGKFPVVSSGGVIGYHREYTTKAPNVVVGRKGTIGQVHFLETDFWAHDTSLFATDFFGNDPLFVYYLCGWLNLGRFGTRSGSPSLNRNDIHPLNVACPNIIEQKRLTTRLIGCDQKIETLNDDLAKLKKLKTGLMQDLLTGKVRVTIEKPVDG
jgi:type I restriction enzyme, S subunit